jgi:hypothetical protein
MNSNTATATACTYLGNSTTPCGHPALEGKSYCAEHYAVVYQKGTARAKRHKEVRTVDRVRLVEQLMNEAVAELEAEGFDCYGERELDLDSV